MNITDSIKSTLHNTKHSKGVTRTPSCYDQPCFVNLILRNRIKWNSYQNTNIWCKKIFENVACKMAPRSFRPRWRKGTPTGAVNRFRTNDTPQILSYHSKLVWVNYSETSRSNIRSCLLAFEICQLDTEYVKLHHTTVQIVIKGIRWSVNETQRVGALKPRSSYQGYVCVCPLSPVHIRCATAAKLRRHLSKMNVTFNC